MIRSPVLIIGCARSGTTLLYNVLSEVPDLWSIGNESKAIIEQYHHPALKGWHSGELSAEDLTPESREYILHSFERQAAPGNFWRWVNGRRRMLNGSRWYTAIKREGRSASSTSGAFSAMPDRGMAVVRQLARLKNVLAPPHNHIRLLDKSPEHCLRLPFLSALFPDARIIFLTRGAWANVASLIEGWRQPHLFPGYRTPVLVTSPGQARGRWAFTLIPGWRNLVDSSLEEICARQWASCNEAVLNYLAGPHALPTLAVRYEEFIGSPDETLERIALFLELSPGSISTDSRPLPLVNTITPPDKEKWRGQVDALTRFESIFAPTMIRLGYRDAPPLKTD